MTADIVHDMEVAAACHQSGDLHCTAGVYQSVLRQFSNQPDALHLLGVITGEMGKLIYACHVLEHFGRFPIAAVLREQYWVLKRGSVLRLAVLNFSACGSICYEEGLRDDFPRWLVLSAVVSTMRWILQHEF